jgi:hypothetical protein
VIQIQQNIKNTAQVKQAPESTESSLIAARFQNRATMDISACQPSEKRTKAHPSAEDWHFAKYKNNSRET